MSTRVCEPACLITALWDKDAAFPGTVCMSPWTMRCGGRLGFRELMWVPRSEVGVKPRGDAHGEDMAWRRPGLVGMLRLMCHILSV